MEGRMKFVWKDYGEVSPRAINELLDEEAISQSGLDDVAEYVRYWTHEGEAVLNENFWCKVTVLNEELIGFICFGKNDGGKFIISEIVISPNKRGEGLGSAMLTELLSSSSIIIGYEIPSAEAVIFPENKASIRAFENAGFEFAHAHPDGDAFYYRYERANGITPNTPNR